MNSVATSKVLLGSLVLALVVLSGQAWSQATALWPSKTVRIIVPFAPGGGSDVSARVLSELFSTQFGQSFIVENKPGAGSAIGVNAAAQSKDGHTLLMGSNSMVINPSFNPSIGYNVATDFDVVGMVSAQPLVLVIPANSEIKSVADLINRFKGKLASLNAGNSGRGTLAHIAAELFEAETGVAMTPIPYKGESALIPDLLSARVDLGFLNLPSVAPHIKAGRLRALAVSAPQALGDFPGVPSFRSLQLESLEVQGWAALLAPKGSISEDGLARLSSALQSALASEAVKAKFLSLNVSPVLQSRTVSAQFIQREGERYAKIIKARNIKPD